MRGIAPGAVESVDSFVWKTGDPRGMDEEIRAHGDVDVVVLMNGEEVFRVVLGDATRNVGEVLGHDIKRGDGVVIGAEMGTSGIPL